MLKGKTKMIKSVASVRVGKATGTRSGPLTLRRRQTVSRFAPHAPDASRFTRQIKIFSAG